MRISSIRLGFANNSSSSHSILIRAQESHHHAGDGEFGWDDFRQNTPEEKAHYVATQLKMAISDRCSGLPDRAICAVVKAIFGLDCGDEDYVDHQSAWTFPAKFDTWGREEWLDEEFAEALRDFIVRTPEISIMGGNDNEKTELPPHEREISLPTDGIRSDWRSVCRNEGDGWWTIFDRNGGTKVRLCLSVETKPEPAFKTPHLVDLKITNKCDRGCRFCYQSSTPEGVHAPFGWEFGEKEGFKGVPIDDICRALSKARVFEVALGGGEPTLHPAFSQILRSFRVQGVVPNFSSWTTAWMAIDDIAQAVRENCGSFAVSTLHPDEIAVIGRWNERIRQESHHCSMHGHGVVQIPLGCHPEAKIVRAVEECIERGVGVTFLGFKAVGRASSITPEPYGKRLFRVMTKAFERWMGASVDSVFVKEHEDWLKATGISKELIVVREGIESCYVDAVEGTINRSSFDNGAPRPFDVSDPFKDFPFTKSDLFD